MLSMCSKRILMFALLASRHHAVSHCYKYMKQA